MIDEVYRSLIGVIHVPPLLGTPFYASGSWPALIDPILADTQALVDAGMDGVLLQTFDRVYSVEDDADPARIAAMSLIVDRVRNVAPTNFQIGVQIMRHAVRASFAVARVGGAHFLRADAIVGETSSTHGVVKPDPLSIMTYRRAIDAFRIKLIADIDSMHYQWIGDNITTADVAAKAITVGADAVCVAHRDPDVVTGKILDIKERSPTTEVFVGGFVTHENASRVMKTANGAFVSGCICIDGRVDRDRAHDLVSIVRSLA